MSRTRRIVRTVLTALLAAVSLGASVCMVGLVGLDIGRPKPGVAAAAGNLGVLDQVQMQLTNSIAGALDGTYAMKKTYWISDSTMVAPKPNPACYGETNDPAELQALIERAQPLLDGQDLYFNPERKLLSNSKVRYYLDDTILSITWKEAIGSTVLTFSENRIAHPSQFRRFLAGGQFGSDTMFRTTEMAQSVNAVVASSGDYYRFRNAGVTVYDGEVRRVKTGIADTCFVDDAGDLHLGYRNQEWTMESAQKYVDENHIRFSLVFGPALVEDGKLVMPNGYALGEMDEKYPRAALCQMDKLHYLIVMANTELWYSQELKLPQFARIILNTGCTTAYTLDGGQTASLAMDGKLVNAVYKGFQRYHSDIIYFATAIPSGE